MGNRVMKSAVVRPAKNYNVEHRAMKVISKDKPDAAPAYPKMRQMMDDIRQDPNLLQKRSKLEPAYEEHLKDVYIKSEGEWPAIVTKQGIMPQDRGTAGTYEFGYEEPENIREGRATLRQILAFLGKNQNNPGTYRADQIAQEYKLKKEDVENILKYFKPFQVFTPPKRNEPSPFMKAIKA